MQLDVTGRAQPSSTGGSQASYVIRHQIVSSLHLSSVLWSRRTSLQSYKTRMRHLSILGVFTLAVGGPSAALSQNENSIPGLIAGKGLLCCQWCACKSLQSGPRWTFFCHPQSKQGLVWWSPALRLFGPWGTPPNVI